MQIFYFAIIVVAINRTHHLDIHEPMEVDTKPSDNPSVVNNNHVHQRNKSKSCNYLYILYFCFI